MDLRRKTKKDVRREYRVHGDFSLYFKYASWGAVKKRGMKTWLLTDSGMTDNPRFVLYEAK